MRGRRRQTQFDEDPDKWRGRPGHDQDWSTRRLPVPDWSPAGDWIVSGSLLIAPDGKRERSIGSHRSPHYVFSKDGKLLYGLRPENGKQTLFSIDVASGAEHTIAPGINFEPGSNLWPSIRFSLAPDGKSIIYGTGLIRTNLWMLEGFNPPGSLAARFGLRR